MSRLFFYIGWMKCDIVYPIKVISHHKILFGITDKKGLKNDIFVCVTLSVFL